MPRDALVAEPVHGVATEEVGLLVERDREAETGLERRVVRRDVGAPRAVALLEPERVDRPVPAGHEAVGSAGLEHRVPESDGELGRGVELPAELADVRHARREARHVADLDVATAHVRERGPRQVVVGHRHQDVARRWPPDPQAGQARRDVADERVLAFLVPPDPREVAAAGAGPGDEPEPIVGEARHRQVGLDPAAAVQHLRVHDPADPHVHVVRAQPLEQAAGRPGRQPRTSRSSSRRTARPSPGRRGARRRSRSTTARPPSRAAADPRAPDPRSTGTSSPAPIPPSHRTRRPASAGARTSAPSGAGVRPRSPRPGTGRRSASRRSRRPWPTSSPCSRIGARSDGCPSSTGPSKVHPRRSIRPSSARSRPRPSRRGRRSPPRRRTRAPRSRRG